MRSWHDILSSETIDFARDLAAQSMETRLAGKTIYPAQESIFRALEMTPPDKVKVCCIGQDPYHGAGQANGLAFSVNKGCKYPPSLRNIFKELQEDIACAAPSSGDLSKWAQEGVLLLNTVLTVEEGRANSHSNWGWQKFTNGVLSATRQLHQPICFILWGASAQAAAVGADVANSEYPRLLIETPHPSPLSAYRGFFGSKPFSKANDFLISNGSSPINWSL